MKKTILITIVLALFLLQIAYSEMLTDPQEITDKFNEDYSAKGLSLRGEVPEGSVLGEGGILQIGETSVPLYKLSNSIIEIDSNGVVRIIPKGQSLEQLANLGMENVIISSDGGTIDLNGIKFSGEIIFNGQDYVLTQGSSITIGNYKIHAKDHNWRLSTTLDTRPNTVSIVNGNIHVSHPESGVTSFYAKVDNVQTFKEPVEIWLGVDAPSGIENSISFQGETVKSNFNVKTNQLGRLKHELDGAETPAMEIYSGESEIIWNVGGVRQKTQKGDVRKTSATSQEQSSWENFKQNLEEKLSSLQNNLKLWFENIATKFEISLNSEHEITSRGRTVRRLGLETTTVPTAEEPESSSTQVFLEINTNINPNNPGDIVLFKEFSDGKTKPVYHFKGDKFFIPPGGDTAIFESLKLEFNGEPIENLNPEEREISTNPELNNDDLEDVPYDFRRIMADPKVKILVAKKLIDEEFIKKTIEVANNIGMDPLELLKLMYLETRRTFSPKIKNTHNCVGLIQFCPTGGQSLLKVTIKELQNMTQIEQMDLVETYFELNIKDLKRRKIDKTKLTTRDYQMMVLWPDAVGQGPNYVFARRGMERYTNNGGLDKNNDGIITSQEYAVSIESHWNGIKA